MSYQLPLPFPRPEEARITYDAASSNIVVSNTTRVGRHNFYTFTVGGRVVGKVDAEFEFKDLPPELHMTAANMILQGGSRLELGCVAHHYWPDRYEPGALSLAHDAVGAVSLATERAVKAPVTWWRRLWRRLWA